MEPKTPVSRRRNPGWIELSVALAALVVSGATLHIARQQTNVMHRQLAASIWPALQLSTSNVRAGEPVIALSLENVGVGPAHVRGFRVTHNGRAVTDFTEFLSECCAPEGVSARTITSFVQGRIFAPGQHSDFVLLHSDANHPETFQRFSRVYRELEIQLCYCSVLEECWTTSTVSLKPEPVSSCDHLAEGQVGE